MAKKFKVRISGFGAGSFNDLKIHFTLKKAEEDARTAMELKNAGYEELSRKYFARANKQYRRALMSKG